MSGPIAKCKKGLFPTVYFPFDLQCQTTCNVLEQISHVKDSASRSTENHRTFK